MQSFNKFLLSWKLNWILFIKDFNLSTRVRIKNTTLKFNITDEIKIII